MTERAMTGHTEGGGGLQKHSLGQYYPYASVILDCGEERWYGVMDTRTGHTLYFPTRDQQERAFCFWKKSLAAIDKTKHTPRNLQMHWVDGPPPAAEKITYVVRQRVVFDVASQDKYGAIIEHRIRGGYSTQAEARIFAATLQREENSKHG